MIVFVCRLSDGPLVAPVIDAGPVVAWAGVLLLVAVLWARCK